MALPSVVSIENLSIRTQHNKLLVSGVNFQLEAGECLAVIGPNGSGKSTLLRALTSELTPSEGGISLNGQSLASFSRQERAKHIAIVAQDDPPDPRLLVEDYVALGRIPHHHCCTPLRHRRCIEQALVDTKLEHLRHRLIGSLSGGEKQRAALARAFSQTPQLLLLDEPTNHLDPLSRATLLSLVRSKGISTIAVLHDLPLIEPFADRVLVMQKGRLVVWGHPEIALSAQIINPVFGMESYTVTHPITGHPLRIFEAPLCA
jgi:iron complex transport system ATP-binding protein